MIKAEDVKNMVSLEDALYAYGIKLNKAGYALCPFHREKTPSFKVKDNRFYCFGCNASGDVIDFVQKYFGLSFTQALEKLDYDFSLGLDDQEFDYQEYEEMKRMNEMIAESIKREKKQESEDYNLVCELLQKCNRTASDKDVSLKDREKALFRQLLLNAILDDFQSEGILLRAFGELWRKNEMLMIEETEDLNYSLVAVLRELIKLRGSKNRTPEEEETIEVLERKREDIYLRLAGLDDVYMDQLFEKMHGYIFSPSFKTKAVHARIITGNEMVRDGRKKETRKWARR